MRTVDKCTKGKCIVTKITDSSFYAVQIEHGQIICEFDPLPEAKANADFVCQCFNKLNGDESDETS